MGHILVVDDSDVLRSIMLRALRRSGLDAGGFLEARSGQEALALVRREPRPCAVLCDVHMPGSDTVELVRLLRERTDVPIVMLATETCADLAQAAVQAGANAWVRKPFTHESIRAALDPLLAAVHAGEGERS